jgi:hypothetical protein
MARHGPGRELVAAAGDVEARKVVDVVLLAPAPVAG